MCAFKLDVGHPMTVLTGTISSLFNSLKSVTHPSTNRAWHGVTSKPNCYQCHESPWYEYGVDSEPLSENTHLPSREVAHRHVDN